MSNSVQEEYKMQQDYHGLSWTIIDHHGLLWTIIDYHGLSWTIMDYHGLSWTIMDYHGVSLTAILQLLESIAMLDLVLPV